MPRPERSAAEPQEEAGRPAGAVRTQPPSTDLLRRPARAVAEEGTGGSCRRGWRRREMHPGGRRVGGAAWWGRAAGGGGTADGSAHPRPARALWSPRAGQSRAAHGARVAGGREDGRTQPRWRRTAGCPGERGPLRPPAAQSGLPPSLPPAGAALGRRPLAPLPAGSLGGASRPLLRRGSLARSHARASARGVVPGPRGAPSSRRAGHGRGEEQRRAGGGAAALPGGPEPAAGRAAAADPELGAGPDARDPRPPGVRALAGPDRRAHPLAAAVGAGALQAGPPAGGAGGGPPRRPRGVEPAGRPAAPGAEPAPEPLWGRAAAALGGPARGGRLDRGREPALCGGGRGSDLLRLVVPVLYKMAGGGLAEGRLVGGSPRHLPARHYRLRLVGSPRGLWLHLHGLCQPPVSQQGCGACRVQLAAGSHPAVERRQVPTGHPRLPELRPWSSLRAFPAQRTRHAVLGRALRSSHHQLHGAGEDLLGPSCSPLASQSCLGRDDSGRAVGAEEEEPSWAFVGNPLQRDRDEDKSTPACIKIKDL